MLTDRHFVLSDFKNTPEPDTHEEQNGILRKLIGPSKVVLQLFLLAYKEHDKIQNHFYFRTGLLSLRFDGQFCQWYHFNGNLIQSLQFFYMPYSSIPWQFI